MFSMIALFRLGRNKWGSCAAGASRHASHGGSAWVPAETAGRPEPGQRRAHKGGGLVPADDERDRKITL